MPPAFSWFLALRYLVTRWVNLIGMLGIAIAVWAMIVVVAVFSGFIGDTRRGIREASPDLLVANLPTRSDYLKLEELLGTDPDVEALAPRLSHDAILFPVGGLQLAKRTDSIAAGAASAGNNYVLLIGIDAAAEAKVTGFRSWLETRTKSKPSIREFGMGDVSVGNPDAPFRVSPARIRKEASRGDAGQDLLGDQPGFLLGRHRLRIGDAIRPGQRVDLVSARFVPSPDDADKFKLKKIKINSYLAGAYETEHRFLDLGTAFIDIEELRVSMDIDTVVGDPELVTEIAIKVRDGVAPETVKPRIDALLKGAGGGIALTWEEQNATYLSAVDRERTLMKIVLFAVLVVAGFLIFATLHMMVVQKTKDIGILTSLGATPTGIGAVFVISSLAIGVAGCTLGFSTGYLCAAFLNDICSLFGWQLFPPTLYAIDEVPIDLEPAWMFQVVAGALILSVIVAWLPARRAARQDPVKALMHE